MSSLKRKEAPPGASTSATKHAKPTTESRPAKKVRSDKPFVKKDFKKDEDKKENKGAKSTDKVASSAPTISRLKEEEPLFPRGGGSVLTPLERKEITIQAKQDALFEDESTKTTTKADKDTKQRKRKSSAKDTKGAKDDGTTRDPDAVRIEGLNYKVRYSDGFILGYSGN